jgi:hypothetical protein
VLERLSNCLWGVHHDIKGGSRSNLDDVARVVVSMMHIKKIIKQQNKSSIAAVDCIANRYCRCITFNISIMKSCVALLTMICAVFPANAFQRDVLESHRSDCGFRATRRVTNQREYSEGLARQNRLNARVNNTRRLDSSTELNATVKKFRNFETMLEAYNDKPILVSFHTKYCGAM